MGQGAGHQDVVAIAGGHHQGPTAQGFERVGDRPGDQGSALDPPGLITCGQDARLERLHDIHIARPGKIVAIGQCRYDPEIPLSQSRNQRGSLGSRNQCSLATRSHDAA